MEIFISIGERLKEEREAMDKTQSDFAEIAAAAGVPGATRQSQAKYEKGLASPSAAYLSAIALRGVDVHYVLTGERDRAQPAPTLTAEEETMLGYFRDASKEVRRAALGALLGASAPVRGHASGSGQNIVGDNAIQIGSVGGKARIKNR